MFGRSRVKDKQQLDQIQQGSKKALAQLYKDCYTTVLNIIIKGGGNETVAEDVMQEAVIAVWQNCRKPDFQLTSLLTTYTIAIAKNIWYKELSKTKNMDVGTDHIKGKKIQFVPHDNDQMDLKIISMMVDEMGDTCRKILVMYYFDGMDMKSIAEALNFSNSNSVKAKKYQCFKRLQEKVLSKYKLEDFL
jgi:RNA polymerase sigma factor (sigma-70 family)